MKPGDKVIRKAAIGYSLGKAPVGTVKKVGEVLTQVLWYHHPVWMLNDELEKV